MTNKERFKEIFISQVTRPGAADLLAWLGTTDFFEAPASTRFHGAYPGGLVEHSLNVYYALLGQSTIREYGGESVAVVALLHDVCKTMPSASVTASYFGLTKPLYGARFSFL